MDEKKPEDKWDFLKVVLDIYETMENSEKGYAYLTDDPVGVSAHYEGRLAMIKMVKETMEKIENGEW